MAVALFDMLLTPAYMPFSTAFAIMVGVGVIEAIGLGVGQFDAQLAADAEVDGGSFLDWLGLGSGLPILIWLTALLGCFTIAGLVLQQAATAILGAPLHWGVASVLALVVGGFANSYIAAGLMRILPRYESTIISTDDLIMRRGTVLEGIARRGHPARAKVVDQHQQAHYVMIEPHQDGVTIAQGETAMLVRREGGVFYALPEADPTLRPV